MTSTATANEEGEISPFRKYLPDLESPRFVQSSQQSPYEYVDNFRKTQVPGPLYNLAESWKELLQEPFQGITTDGKIQTNLFKPQDGAANIDRIVEAANKVLENLDGDDRARLTYPLNAQEWRCWSNPEFLLRPFGLRLEEISDNVVKLILGVIEASFSTQGYHKALSAMRINHFLGEICEVPRIMNKYSYNFLLFGTPSKDKAWGWSLYGHHLCLNVFLKGGHISISPTFTGAEPNLIDRGEFAGTKILHREGELGLQLMQSLSGEQQNQAQIYKQLKDPAMLQTGDLKVDRWNPDDQRHVCGAFRDNRIVPYEGVCAKYLSPDQKQLILDIVEQFILYLPDLARQKRLEQIRQHWGETHFCWIGGYQDQDAYYFRIQSPVIICEFDHHSGVFLTNAEPARFHIHTLVRTPNGGDYGNALRDAEDKVR